MEQGYRTISRKTLRPLQKDIRKITFLCKAECSRKRIIQYSIMIKFGTDGWRARIAEEFNFDNVRRVAKAHAEVLKEKGVKRVIVGYDWRFRSEDFAKAVYDVFRSEGLEAKLVGSACTTPMVSFAVKYLGYENGVMITASHNPPAYNGYKIKESFGGSATPEFVKNVEEKVKDIESVEIKEFEPEYQEVRKKYVEKIREFFDMDLFKEKKTLVVHDSMHGTSSGLLDFVLRDTKVSVINIRKDRDPLFGGHPPEPIEKYMEITKEKVRALGAELGIANDGDGDRIALVDDKGNYVNTQLIYAMLLLHLLENKGKRGKVVKTVSTTYLADRICKEFGVPLIEVGVGFKNINEIILKEGGVIFGGEESGGYGIPEYLPERDGIFSALNILELLYLKDKKVSEVVAEIFERFGEAYYKRVDLRVKEKIKGRIKELKENPPERIGEFKVREVKTIDGVKFVFEDDSWLLMRPSGTEPLIRVYAETPTKEEVEKIIQKGLELLK
ncbi:phosphoglucomutase/phosphomannomutase [Aquifex aeolicus VF5]|uniref:Phosphoglucomutase/phosphomannomutase n=2 Tax=Aquifex aeolicus TaxID=63363 RepID=O66791_AQUAE|nr:phosphoglucomutase/phosphomannomutase [Aquifex aeolicus VF5]